MAAQSEQFCLAELTPEMYIRLTKLERWVVSAQYRGWYKVQSARFPNQVEANRLVAVKAAYYRLVLFITLLGAAMIIVDGVLFRGEETSSVYFFVGVLCSLLTAGIYWSAFYRLRQFRQLVVSAGISQMLDPRSDSTSTSGSKEGIAEIAAVAGDCYTALSRAGQIIAHRGFRRKVRALGARRRPITQAEIRVAAEEAIIDFYFLLNVLAVIVILFLAWLIPFEDGRLVKAVSFGLLVLSMLPIVVYIRRKTRLIRRYFGAKYGGAA